MEPCVASPVELSLGEPTKKLSLSDVKARINVTSASRTGKSVKNVGTKNAWRLVWIQAWY